MTDPAFLLQLVLALGLPVGVYAGIRADLARLHAKADAAIRDAGRANDRIDQLINHRRD